MPIFKSKSILHKTHTSPPLIMIYGGMVRMCGAVNMETNINIH